MKDTPFAKKVNFYTYLFSIYLFILLSIKILINLAEERKKREKVKKKKASL